MWSVDVWSVLLVVVVFLVTWYVWQRVRSPLPPGPTPIPLLGNASLTFSKRPLRVLHHLRQKYDRVMTVYLGPIGLVILNDFDTIREAFVTRLNDFAGRAPAASSEIITEGYRDIALSDYGPEWSLHRRLAMVALKKFADKNTVSHLVSENTTEVCEMMVEETRKAGKTSNMLQKVYLLIYNVIVSVVFSKKFKPDDQDFKILLESVGQMNEILGTGLLADFLPFLKFMPTPDKSRLSKALQKMFDYMNRNIAEHKATLDTSNPRDITDSILIAREEMEREGSDNISFFTEVHLRQTITDIFSAGTDTTCFTLLWIILYCIRYPELQEKVYEEIEANVGTRMITVEDRGKLPFTEAFTLEVMRMRPIAPLALPHTPMSATAELCGYQIPRGTNVVPNIWSCHYDPRYWTEPEHFHPQRFITPDGKVIHKPDSFLPFGVGRRACAGEQLARVDTLLIFATLLQKVKFSAVDPKEPPTLEPGTAGGGGVFFCVTAPYDVVVESR